MVDFSNQGGPDLGTASRPSWPAQGDRSGEISASGLGDAVSSLTKIGTDLMDQAAADRKSVV